MPFGQLVSKCVPPRPRLTSVSKYNIFAHSHNISKRHPGSMGKRDQSSQNWCYSETFLCNLLKVGFIDSFQGIKFIIICIHGNICCQYYPVLLNSFDPSG